ncbi:transposase [Bradyrhizobium sp. 180]|nr:transposase [Bradyrhizobium sp. 180]
MKRRKFSREFKIAAVKLVRERGVSVAQAGRDLDVHENVLRKWVKEFGSDPVQAFPGHGQMKLEQQEIERLRRVATTTSASANINSAHLKEPSSLLRPGKAVRALASTSRTG